MGSSLVLKGRQTHPQDFDWPFQSVARLSLSNQPDQGGREGVHCWQTGGKPMKSLLISSGLGSGMAGNLKLYI